MAEVTPAQLREKAATALEEPGARRLALMAELAQLDEELRPLVLRAVRAEVPGRRIQALTGLSRTTVQAWSKAAT